jgi:hypothetical protein
MKLNNMYQMTFKDSFGIKLHSGHINRFSHKLNYFISLYHVNEHYHEQKIVNMPIRIGLERKRKH